MTHDLVFYGASDDLIEFDGRALVEGRGHVNNEEFTLPRNQEALVLVVFEELAMGIHVAYRGITRGIWSLAPVMLRENTVLPWRVSIEDGASYAGDVAVPDYSMVLTVHDVPDGVTVVGPEYDGG